MARIVWRSGSLAVLAGLLWAGFHTWYILDEVNFPASGAARPAVALVGVAALCMMLVWFSISQRTPAGTASRATALLCAAGTSLLALGALLVALVDWAWLIAIAGEFLTSLGLIAFGVSALVERVGPRVGLPVLALVVLYVPSWMLDASNLPRSFPSALPEMLALLYGLGWVLLGATTPLFRAHRNPAR